MRTRIAVLSGVSASLECVFVEEVSGMVGDGNAGSGAEDQVTCFCSLCGPRLCAFCW